MISRIILNALKEKLIHSDKIIILYGARQVGKTTLVKHLLSDLPYKSLQINADEYRYQSLLSSGDLNQLTRVVEGYELVFIDEAQRVPDIGLNLKILHDARPELKLIVTGSSSFELANRTKEPLTGRTWTFTLFPVSVAELRQSINAFELDEKLEELLLYGFYPDVLNLNSFNEKADYLSELSSSYLYRDILEISSIRHGNELSRLLRLLAFQIGSEVSMTELGNALQMSKDTVASYVDLLEKSFVLFRLTGFSRNLRKEISKRDKLYFFDLGVRNALIQNFQPLELRTDVGALWENFLVIERLKRNKYIGKRANSYFWRTYTGAELDYIEEEGGKLDAFEFKFTKHKAKVPATWESTYANSSFELINRYNFQEFLI